MNVLFLFIVYPDVKENSSMYTDLTMEFASKGHKVFVAVANGPCKTTINNENGIKVLRVKTLELYNTSIFKKGLANILLPYQVMSKIRQYFHTVIFDVIIIPTPPITYLSTVKKLKKKSKSKLYLILRDIFPQNAWDLGIIRSRILFNYFRAKEKKLYAISDFIGCMSQGNIEYVRKYNPEVESKKLHLLPNWKNIVNPKNEDPDIRKKYILENKYIALYGGNLGKPQQLGFILELADAVKHLTDIVFLIIGDGTEKKKMIKDSIKMNLSNVLFMNTLPRDKYQEVAKICDIGLINNSSLFTIPNFPSRTLSYWEAKLPILAAINKNTDYGEILERSGSGLGCLTGDINVYMQNFMKLYSNKALRISMGESGYNYLVENCLTSQAYKTIIEKLSSNLF